MIKLINIVLLISIGDLAFASSSGFDEAVVDVSKVIREPGKYSNQEFVIGGILKIDSRPRLYLFAEKPSDEFDNQSDYIDVSPPPKWRGVSDAMDLNYVCIVGKFEDYNDDAGIWVGGNVSSKAGVFSAQSINLCTPAAK